MLCHVLVLHAKARLFVSTGSPVAPHSFDGLTGLAVTSRWVKVPHELFEHVAFADDADTPHGFCFQFSCQEPEEDMPCISPVVIRLV